MQIVDAARAVGTTRKAIRRWIEKDEFAWLAHARTGQGKAAEFSPADMLRMSLVVTLLDWGATVKQAAWLVPEIIDKEINDDGLPLFMELFGTAIVSRRAAPGSWRVTIGTHEADAVAQHLEDGPAAVKLVINLRELFREVLDRIEALENEKRAA